MANIEQLKKGNFASIEIPGTRLWNPRIVKSGIHDCKFVYTYLESRMYTIKLLSGDKQRFAAVGSEIELPQIPTPPGLPDISPKICVDPVMRNGRKSTRTKALTVIADDRIPEDVFELIELLK